ncbi:hypothetical protein NL676_035422 [Syzygium grande]|nr:hypothetical protein NL676_035422 [Syzygium grande]
MHGKEFGGIELHDFATGLKLVLLDFHLTPDRFVAGGCEGLRTSGGFGCKRSSSGLELPLREKLNRVAQSTMSIWSLLRWVSLLRDRDRNCCTKSILRQTVERHESGTQRSALLAGPYPPAAAQGSDGFIAVELELCDWREAGKCGKWPNVD